jgi:hypothetical protein
VSKYRLWLAHSAIMMIIGGSLYCIATDREYWPFSQYPMFAGLREGGPKSILRLYAITEGEFITEIPLESNKYIQPFDRSRITAALRRICGREDHKRLLTAALSDCLQRYEALRRVGRHSGPPIQGIRLYRLEWWLGDPRLFDANKPNRRDLLAEVWLPLDGGL